MVWKHEVCETKWRPILKYNFLDSYLFCFVYKIFAVLYLRIRLFNLLCWPRGRGMVLVCRRRFRFLYFTIFFYLFYCHFIFSLLFIYPRHLPTPTPTTHDPHPLSTTSTHDPRHLATLHATRDELSKSDKWNKILIEKKGSLIVSGRRWQVMCKIRRPPGQNFFCNLSPSWVLENCCWC